mgnify:CR=1 FL=1
MELSRTINSDKRYYLDKKTIENAASLLETMRVFNDAKMDLYNALYDQKYLNAGPLLDHAYPVFFERKNTKPMIIIMQQSIQQLLDRFLHKRN